MKEHRNELQKLREGFECMGTNRWHTINTFMSCKTFDALHDILRKNCAAVVQPGSAGSVDEVGLFVCLSLLCYYCCCCC